MARHGRGGTSRRDRGQGVECLAAQQNLEHPAPSVRKTSGDIHQSGELQHTFLLRTAQGETSVPTRTTRNPPTRETTILPSYRNKGVKSLALGEMQSQLLRSHLGLDHERLRRRLGRAQAIPVRDDRGRQSVFLFPLAGS